MSADVNSAADSGQSLQMYRIAVLPMREEPCQSPASLLIEGCEGRILSDTFAFCASLGPCL